MDRAAALMADLDAIRERVDLVALIGQTVRLTRRGKEWWGLCPFHNERTPSFVVNRQRYHCFGCGEHGDCFSWLTETKGMTFVEAITQLGGDLPRETAAERRRREERAREAERRERIWRFFADQYGMPHPRWDDAQYEEEWFPTARRLYEHHLAGTEWLRANPSAEAIEIRWSKTYLSGAA